MSEPKEQKLSTEAASLAEKITRKMLRNWLKKLDSEDGLTAAQERNFLVFCQTNNFQVDDLKQLLQEAKEEDLELDDSDIPVMKVAKRG